MTSVTSRLSLMAAAALAAGLAVSGSSRGEVPSFDDFYTGVAECRLNLTRYADLLGPHHEAVVIALPSVGAVRGFLIDSFYFSPQREGEPEQYGLLINAPLDAVGKAFPELAERRAVNGYLRRLVRLSEQSRERNAGRKTLLICTGGWEI